MRAALILILAVLVSACGPAPQAPAPPAPPDLSGWQPLYTRPGWDGQALADLRIVGDVMLGRYVAAAVEQHGASYPFADVAGLLGGDLTIGNLESPLSERREQIRPGPYRLLAAPAMASALAEASFDALSLANNHGLDAGPDGLGDSLAALAAAGVRPLGAGSSSAAAGAATIIEAGGLRVALLAFNDVVDPADGPVALAPSDDRAWPNPDFAACAEGAICPPGRAWLDAAALDAVAAARAAADLVLVLPHWGQEYAGAPSARQRAWAAELVAAGADLVVGAHPHVLQPAEPLSAGGRDGFVAYSLGNFIFDAPDDPAISSGAVLRALADEEGLALVAAAPLATAGGRPRPLDLESEAGRAALAVLRAQEAQPATPTPAPPAPRPTAPSPAAPALTGSAAWRWDGAQGQPAPPPQGPLPVHPTSLPADLRGDGVPVWASLDEAGVVTLRDGPDPNDPLLWRNEEPDWRFTRIAAGDPNDDGRVELMLLLWQPDDEGRLRSQPYLLGWRGGRYRIIWGGSATQEPIQDFALADLDADGRGELVVLEGGAAPGDPGQHVSVWRWHGWGFQLEWRSPAGSWAAVGLADTDGDGRAEIVAQAE